MSNENIDSALEKIGALANTTMRQSSIIFEIMSVLDSVKNVIKKFDEIKQQHGNMENLMRELTVFSAQDLCKVYDFRRIIGNDRKFSAYEAQVYLKHAVDAKLTDEEVEAINNHKE